MKLRLLVDTTGEDRFLQTDRDPAQLVRDAMQFVRATNHGKAIFRLCIHVSDDTLTLHWYAADERSAKWLIFAAETIQRATAGILTGRVPA